MTTILIDVSFLAYQAIPDLSFKKRPTGAVYGILVRILNMAGRFGTTDFHLCFDSPTAEGVRRKEFPGYKLKRHSDLSDEKVEERRQFYAQVSLFREVAAEIGFPCYEVPGFESDDIIAHFAKLAPADNGVIIVSSDKDLYQCLGKPTVKMFNPNKHAMTRESDLPYTAREAGLLKAIAGCASDEVPGVPQVGEKRALAYLRGDTNLLKTKPAWLATLEASKDIIERNKRLVLLPHPDFPSIKKKSVIYISESFWQVCEELGFESFLRAPYEDRWIAFFNGEIDALKKKSNAPMGKVRQRRIRSGQEQGFGF